MNALRLCTLALALLGLSVSVGAADCEKLSEVCVEGPETREISGYTVYRECWRYRAQFTCLSQTVNDDCQPLRDRGCSQIGSKCIDTGPRSTCAVLEQTWQCKVSGGTSSTITNCGGQQFCLDGRCFDTGYAPDTDFAKSVALLEAQREAGHYLDPNTLELFKGYDNRCRKKLFGLTNCCKGASGAGTMFSNVSMISGAGGKVLGAVGSTYTYDSLFASDAPQWVLDGFEALFGVGGGSSALAGVLAGDLSVELFVQSLVPGPWTIVMLIIQFSGILDCDQDEQVLAMKRDARLCTQVGSYCSQKLLGSCMETKEAYCCFNSRLARIINEQGRTQLAKGWGAPQSPDCSGFTIAQLQGLDFSRMDLSEFYADIAPTLPNLGAMQQRAQQKIESYYKP